jgi:hypothetical protein
MDNFQTVARIAAVFLRSTIMLSPQGSHPPFRERGSLLEVAPGCRSGSVVSCCEIEAALADLARLPIE